MLHSLDETLRSIHQATFPLTQRGEQVSELSRADVAIAVLVKVTQALNEVLGRVCAAVLADGLQDRQEHVKADPLICKHINQGTQHRRNQGQQWHGRNQGGESAQSCAIQLYTHARGTTSQQSINSQELRSQACTFTAWLTGGNKVLYQASELQPANTLRPLVSTHGQKTEKANCAKRLWYPLCC